MSVLRNLYARSEQWRLEWGCRTCVSVALVTLLCLYEPTRRRFAQFGVTGFALVSVATVFVKDQTLGQTLLNGWSTMLGTFIGSFLAWILFKIYREFYANYLPLWLILATEFVMAFLLQYSEMVPIVRKFSICVFAINIIANQNNAHPDFRIWGLFISMGIGSACAVAGALVPLPVRLAGTELKQRVAFYSDVTAALMQDVTITWANTYQRERTKSPSSIRSGVTLAKVEADSPCVQQNGTVGEFPAQPSLQRFQSENPHWRKLRLLVAVLASFRRYNRPGLATGHKQKRDFNTRIIRAELMSYLEECLPYLQSRNAEAKFGPSRRMAMRCTKYVKLLQDIMLIITRLETHVENMEKMPKYHYAYTAFFSRPNLRYSLDRYGCCLGQTILSICSVLQVQNSLHDDLLRPCPEAFAAVEAAARLVKARTLFDSEYLKARRDVFYPERGTDDEGSPQVVLKGDDTPRADRARKGSVASTGNDSPYIRQRRTASTSSQPTNQNANQELQGRPKSGALQIVGLRAYGKAMLDLNSAVFLLDTMSRLLLEFWPLDELSNLGNSAPAVILKAGQSSQRTGEADKFAVGRAAIVSTEDFALEEGHDSVMLPYPTPEPHWLFGSRHKTAVKFYKGLVKFFHEIFPTRQSHLLCFTVTPNWQVQWALTPALRQRLISSLTVAVGMVLGAWYGIASGRPSPALPSFTIAFLAGGAVSGINVMTCINRAAG
jgi:hypothetical protein